MSREKQNDEMAKIASKCMTKWLNNETPKALPDYIAEAFYNAGYRKQSKPFPQAHENGDKWISVEDRLPEETGKYLVSTKNGVVYQTKYYSGGKWGQKDKGKNITHWMPMPDAPKGGAE